MRIAIGGILHETSTFAKTPTTIRDFETGFGLYRGEEILKRFRGANICTGGFLEGAEALGFDVVPLLWAFAYPSGLIARKDYEALKNELLDRLKADEQANGPVDGVLLDLHGAMVVEGIDDGDGDLIVSVREFLGPDRPLIVTFDLHGNHTKRRVAKADVIIGFDTYPHIDMAERGREAAELMVRMLQREIRPVMALRQLPMFWGVSKQVTAHPPMNEVIARAHELERRPGMLSVTVATGFPWADVPEMGASVIAVADKDQSLAENAAEELANWIWDRRATWQQPIVTVAEALEKGQSLGKYPIILADHADNTGGGAAGDSTEILRTFLDQKLDEAVVLYIVDPEVAEAAHRAGVGSRLSIEVGGKSDPIQGPPVKMEAEVMAVSDGDFTYDGPMFAGLTGNMGRSAWLKQDGVSVVVVTAGEQPLGPAFAKTLGIDCTRMKYIALKSAAHFRASFEPIAGSIHNVDAQAVHTHDFKSLPHKNRREFYPTELS